MALRDHRQASVSIVQSDRRLAANKCYLMPAESDSICVLDDDASVRHSIVQLLDSDGFKAQSFEDAEVFFAHARRHSVQLVVVDVWMPETSGLQVQARLRQESPYTKVIVMTGRETPAVRAAAFEGGAYAFLAKPFDDEAFLSLVRQALLPAA
jgi:FixJ family two-component response regulator